MGCCGLESKSVMVSISKLADVSERQFLTIRNLIQQTNLLVLKGSLASTAKGSCWLDSKPVMVSISKLADVSAKVFYQKPQWHMRWFLTAALTWFAGDRLLLTGIQICNGLNLKASRSIWDDNRLEASYNTMLVLEGCTHLICWRWAAPDLNPSLLWSESHRQQKLFLDST